MFSALFFWLVGLNGPVITVPDDLLADYDLHRARIGFVFDNHLYLSYLHVIAKIDMGGNLVANYAKKGQGPGEFSGGPIFHFGAEIWCRNVVARRMVILDSNLEFKREIQMKFLPSNPGQYDIAPGASSVYLLMMEGLAEKKPYLKIQARNPGDFSLEREFILSSIPVDFNKLKLGFVLGMNYLGDNQFAIYSECQPTKEYEIHIWNSKDQSLKRLTHLTPQLPPESIIHQPVFIVMGSGGSSIGAVYNTSKGYAVFLEAKEINPAKNKRDLNWYTFTHLFDRSLKPYETSRDNTWVIKSSGLSDAMLVRHPDLGVEVKGY